MLKMVLYKRSEEARCYKTQVNTFYKASSWEKYWGWVAFNRWVGFEPRKGW
jgi:hypothetical protein